MADIIIDMRLFGAFRKYGDAVSFTVPAGSTVGVIKQRLAAVLDLADPLLIGDSALADDSEILPPDAVFTANSRLAILPPVCGG